MIKSGILTEVYSFPDCRILCHACGRYVCRSVGVSQKFPVLASLKKKWPIQLRLSRVRNFSDEGRGITIFAIAMILFDEMARKLKQYGYEQFS